MNLSKITCPTCQKENTWKSDNPSRPFCSHRCKLIDLGDWIEEKNRVLSESNDSHYSTPEDQA